MLYLLVVMPHAWNNQPVSNFLGLPKNDANSLLLDLCVAALPIVGVIAGYLAILRRKQRQARKNFLDEFEGSELVRARYNPNILYKVLSRTPEGGIEKMQVVWSIKGRCRGGTIYEDVDEAGVSDFDADRFLNGE